MTEDTVEDERDTELSSISAIFPELVIHPNDTHSAFLDIEVSPKDPFSIKFRIPRSYSLSSNTLASPPSPPSDGGHSIDNSHTLTETPDIEIRELTYLPSLHLEITLSDEYPQNAPPQFTVSVQPPWVPLPILQKLNNRGKELWQEYGQSQVVWLFIDELQQEAENAFGLSPDSMVLSHELKVPMCSFDTETKRRKFEESTFDCGICLEPKKGSACYSMRHCGHIFCVSCLQDFYNQAIAEGDVANVKCLAPDCGCSPDGSKKAQRPLHPSELLEIPLERPVVQRYLNMKVKKIVESDTNTLYCPRKWCQGPARNPRFDKYRNATIEDFPEDDPEEVVPDGTKPEGLALADTERLSICSTCSFAFCRQCLRSWHGDHIRCLPPDLKKLTEEELASYDYIRLHTSPCPTCNAPVQKAMGCNHMTCSTCRTHFCYLCSSWLDGQNPYSHFNTLGTECYQRLFELEEGDNGDDDGAAFGGARGAEAAAGNRNLEDLMVRFADEIQERMRMADQPER